MLPTEWIPVVTIVVGLISSTWYLAWWFSGKFTAMNKLVYEQIEKVLNKLEYHEKHDDKRFSDIRDDIWDIRVRKGIIKNISTKRDEE